MNHSILKTEHTRCPTQPHTLHDFNSIDNTASYLSLIHSSFLEKQTNRTAAHDHSFVRIRFILKRAKAHNLPPFFHVEVDSTIKSDTGPHTLISGIKNIRVLGTGISPGNNPRLYGTSPAIIPKKWRVNT